MHFNVKQKSYFEALHFKVGVKYKKLPSILQCFFDLHQAIIGIEKQFSVFESGHFPQVLL